MGGRNQLHKEVRELVKYAEELGFIWHGFNGRGHPDLRHPNGGKTTISATPSKYSGRRNAEAQLRRIARGDFR